MRCVAPVVGFVALVTACGGSEPPGPSLLASSPRLDFGRVPVGATARVQFELTSIGDAAGELRATIVGDLATEARLEGVPARLVVGRPWPIEAVFVPTSVGVRVGAAHFSVGDATVDVGLFGEGVSDPIEIQPASLDFGVVLIGRAATRSMRITNRSPEPIVIGSVGPEVGATDDFSVRLAGSARLPPGGSLDFDIEFTPTRAGVITGRFVVADDSGAATPARFDVAGIGAGQALAITPPVVRFDGALVDRPMTRTLTLRNLGTEVEQIRVVHVDDAAGVFSVPTATTTLGPSDLARLAVTYRSSDVADHSGSIFFASDRGWSGSVSLLATAEPAVVPTLDVAPMALDFGTVATGTMSHRQLRLHNPSGVPLTIAAVDINPRDAGFSFARSPRRSDVMDPLDTEYVDVFWTSTATTAQATLTVRSTAFAGDVLVALSARGAPDARADVRVHPAEVDMGRLGQIRAVRLRNEGTASARVTGIEIDEPAILLDLAGTSLVLAPGAEAPLVVGRPPTIDVQSTLRFRIDGEPWVIPIRARRAAPAARGIEVFLSTNEALADLDLHLVREDGQFFDDPTDACWCNPQPNWGLRHAEVDDPVVVVESTDGTRNEVIRIDAPQTGRYVVVVHYRSGSAAANAHVVVAVGGQSLSTNARRLAPGDRWEAAIVTRSVDGTVSVGGALSAPVVSRVATCY